MTSLRRRLFLLLLGATGALWLCAVAWISLGSRAELEHVLDNRLREAATMVHSLVSNGNLADAPSLNLEASGGYARQLSCQIWSMDGRLVGRSSGAPSSDLAADTEGFADRTVNGETWRVYTIVDATKGVRVTVGDRIGLRDRLVRDLVAGLLAPAVLILPLLGLLIWVGVGRGLRPLAAVAGDIAGRDAEDMRPVPTDGAPAEVRPLLTALNGLFSKVEAARSREREVTAFAAHELRTPLAGLKTQAQVALAADDAPTREGALRQILVSVDRAARLVRQLLALSRLEASPAPKRDAEVDAGRVLREVIESSHRPPQVNVDLHLLPDGLKLKGDQETLHLVLRNLHENAVEHMAAGGRITWAPVTNAQGMATGLMVEDEGPGVAEAELPLITRRFYRGRHKSASGTGLGLTIAEMAAGRLGARLTFANRADRSGLRAALLWG